MSFKFFERDSARDIGGDMFMRNVVVLMTASLLRPLTEGPSLTTQKPVAHFVVWHHGKVCLW
ncbi:Hypothetical protein SMAX5B_019683 [Scophthalmus maximus]|uniref:Uncharacterized protein n=1 Tax=Scophthalmus maximus TaxID=52904 RepID=A0A2U9CTU3_SCOMX|nr:Hypothetical protein SMAX5B_019683 [Scophthalmus maximus]